MTCFPLHMTAILTCNLVKLQLSHDSWLLSNEMSHMTHDDHVNFSIGSSCTSKKKFSSITSEVQKLQVSHYSWLLSHYKSPMTHGDHVNFSIGSCCTIKKIQINYFNGSEAGAVGTSTLFILDYSTKIQLNQNSMSFIVYLYLCLLLAIIVYTPYHYTVPSNSGVFACQSAHLLVRWTY